MIKQKVVNQFSKYFIGSNLYISLCALSHFCYFSLKVHNLILPIESAIVFLGTIFSYNLMRLESKIRKKQPIANYRFKLFSLVLICIALSSLTLNLQRDKILNLLHLALLVCSYELTSKNLRGIRYIPYIKPIIISYVWTMACYGLSTNYENLQLSSFSSCFIFILLLSIPFDIKDKEYDRVDKLMSIVNIIPDKKLKDLLSSLYLVFSLIMLVMSEFQYLLLAPLYLYLLKSTKKQQAKWSYNYGFDGIIIITSLLGIYFR